MPLLFNLAVPGLGSLLGSRRLAGTLQLLLFVAGIAGIAHLFHVGVPLVNEGDLTGLGAAELARIFWPPAALLVAWVWALVTGVVLRRSQLGPSRVRRATRRALHGIVALYRSAAKTARERRTGRVVLYAVTSLIAAGLVTKAYLLHDNTLHQNGRWTTGKTELAQGVNGAVAFLTTHTALARDRLDLGAWHGFQEVLYKDRIDASEVSFDFELADQAHFAFIHERDENGFAGVRLSRDPRFPSQSFTASLDGSFSSSAPIAATVRPGRHRFHATFEAGAAAIDVDGEPLVTVPAPPGPRTIGFRSGLRSTLIDNVEIVPVSGATITEGFGSRRPPFGVFAVMLGIVLGLGALVQWRRASPLHANVVLCFGVLLFGTLDWLYLSSLHPRIVLDWGGYKSTIETKPAVLARLREQAAVPPAPGTDRILFVGSSQTWGSGARRSGEAFVDRVCALLDRDGGRHECINAAICGEWAPALVELYEKEWSALRPRLVVVNLGNNDGNPRAFAGALDDLATFNHARGIPTLFVVEANSTEADTAALEKKHALMREVADRHQIKVLDLHHQLAAHRDDGYLWWDFVHLTSFGHRLAAEYLAAEIRPSLTSTLASWGKAGPPAQ